MKSRQLQFICKSPKGGYLVASGVDTGSVSVLKHISGQAAADFLYICRDGHR